MNKHDTNTLIPDMAYVGRDAKGKIRSMCCTTPRAAEDGLRDMRRSKLTVTLENLESAKAEWIKQLHEE